MKPVNAIHWGHTGEATKRSEKIKKGKRGKVKRLANTIPGNNSDTKYARTHLSEREYNQRMKRYEERAKIGLPLFTRGRRVKQEPIIICAGCNKIPPKKSYLHIIGWRRDIFDFKIHGIFFSILWCPNCQKVEKEIQCRNQRNEQSKY